MLKRKNRPASTNCFSSERPPTRPSIKYVLAVSLAMLFIPIRSAMSQFVPPGVPVAGKTRSEWIEARGIWAYSAPPGIRTDQIDGTYNHLGQEGPVWFLGSGTPGDGIREKAYTVPADKYVLAPLVSTLVTDDPNKDLASIARGYQDAWDSLFFELNEFSIPEEELMTDYRESTGAFHYELPPPNCCSETETLSGYAAIEGRYIMLEPLPPGQHTIRHGGGKSSEDFYFERTTQLFSFDNPADFNFDADVDSADLTAQTKNWTGASVLGKGERMLFIHGDTDFDGDIDTADQTILNQNWTGAMAGNPEDGEHAKLIYDPSTGHITLDATETASGKFVSFAMANALATDLVIEDVTPEVEDLRPENAQFPFNDTGTNTDSETIQIGQTDTSGNGVGPIVDLGEIFPSGLADAQTLSEYLTLAEYASDLGVGGRLGLIVRGSGDFDADFVLTAQDVDQLSAEIAALEPRDWFDLNGDDLVDQFDRVVWVESLANSSFGDADLNGKVEFADFLSLSSSFGQEGGWAQGDFDGSGIVQFADFLLLSSNFGQTTEAIATVPEPGPLMTILVLTVGVARLRSHRRYAV